MMSSLRDMVGRSLDFDWTGDTPLAAMVMLAIVAGVFYAYLGKRD
jgi:hypothetical protein